MQSRKGRDTGRGSEERKKKTRIHRKKGTRFLTELLRRNDPPPPTRGRPQNEGSVERKKEKKFHTIPRHGDSFRLLRRTRPRLPPLRIPIPRVRVPDPDPARRSAFRREQAVEKGVSVCVQARIGTFAGEAQGPGEWPGLHWIFSRQVKRTMTTTTNTWVLILLRLFSSSIPGPRRGTVERRARRDPFDPGSMPVVIHGFEAWGQS